MNQEKNELFWLAAHGGVESVRKAIEAGADVNAVSPPPNNTTPLHIAAEYDRLDMAKLLIEMGADLKAETSGGATPLHSAVSKDKIDMAKLLIESGADVNAKDRGRHTPLHYAAVLLDKIDMAKLLIERGADVNTKNSADRTPLHEAVARRATDMVDLLLQNKADVNAKDCAARTPLHEVAIASKQQPGILLEPGLIVRSLLEHGANLYARDEKGKTPAESTESEAMQLFLKRYMKMDRMSRREQQGYKAAAFVVEVNEEDAESFKKAYEDGDLALFGISDMRRVDAQAEDKPAEGKWANVEQDRRDKPPAPTIPGDL